MPPIPLPKIRLSRLARNLRRARRKARLTQLALAHASGYKGRDAGAHICRIESGRQTPQVKTLVRISKALGLSLTELL
jgi:transcriptional regulator with XRE-family HTH domain